VDAAIKSPEMEKAAESAAVVEDGAVSRAGLETWAASRPSARLGAW
jgi:hypothetical protein